MGEEEAVTKSCYGVCNAGAGFTDIGSMWAETVSKTVPYIPGGVLCYSPSDNKQWNQANITKLHLLNRGSFVCSS